MAYVKIGDTLRHREPEFVIAVSDVLQALAPENDVDEGQAFKALAQAANRRMGELGEGARRHREALTLSR